MDWHCCAIGVLGFKVVRESYVNDGPTLEYGPWIAKRMLVRLCVCALCIRWILFVYCVVGQDLRLVKFY